MGGKPGRSLVVALVVLPGSALVFIPAAVLWLSAGTPLAASVPSAGDIVLGAAVGVPAAVLMASTVSLFLRHGEGTPAPWEPPRRLVVRGPYRYVRNPMITGVMLFQMAEAVVFSSWALAGWACVFFLANAVYFPLVEEKGLERRFGAEYVEYKRNVPRWLPRLRPWKPES